MNYEDIKAKFPNAYAVGSEILTRIEHEVVVVATYIDGVFSFTEAGGAAPEQEAAPETTNTGDETEGDETEGDETEETEEDAE